MKIQETWATAKTGDGPMSVFIAAPDSGQKAAHKAILVFQEAFGVNGHIQRICARFAQQGYIAAAPELFHRHGDHFEISYDDLKKVMPTLSTVTNSQILDDATAAHQLLVEHPLVDGSSIGAIGYCMGGFAAALSACHLPLKAAVSYYGGGMVHVRPNIGFTPIVEDFVNLRCPLLLVYGEKDQSIPKEDRDAVTARLKALSKKFEVWVYSDAGHAFFCEDRPAYHAPSAKEVWPKTLAWLDQHLL